MTERKCVEGREKEKSVCERESEHVRKEIKSGRGGESKTEVENKSEREIRSVWRRKRKEN